MKRSALVASVVLLILAGVMSIRQPGSARLAGTPVASPGASPAASPAGRSVSVAGSVTINLGDSGFDPVYVESTNGHDLTITLVNTGTRRHSFRIDRYQVNVALDPGQRTTIVIKNPSLGDFPYYSDAPGDEGMKGMLVFYI